MAWHDMVSTQDKTKACSILPPMRSTPWPELHRLEGADIVAQLVVGAGVKC